MIAMTPTVVVAALALASVALVFVFLVLQRRDRETGEELREVRRRLDALVDVQRDVPRQVAEGAAIQARSLTDVRERLVEMVEATRRIETVGASVAEVHDLLRVPKLRGTMGEVWLAEALREVLPAGTFETEYTFRTGERVDAIVRLQDRLIPIDAKFPMDAYQRLRQARGDDLARARRAFERSVRARVDEIADKYIRPDEGTFEFALMYIPAEGVFAEATVAGGTADESIGSYAHARNVFLVSPNTLYAYLSALAHGLRGLAVEQHAREILELLGGLRQAFNRFGESFARMGRHLEHAIKQHDEAARLLDDINRRLDRITDTPG